jgi:exosortase/archaeosortase family protein
MKIAGPVKLESAAGIVLLCMCLKLVHYILQFSGAEIYLLKFIAAVTGVLTGTVFTEANSSEYVSDCGLFIISSACSGWRLFMLYFLYAHLYRIFYKSALPIAWGGFFKRSCFIYLFSLLVNIVRIVFFIRFHYLLISGGDYLFKHALISMLTAVCGCALLIPLLKGERNTQYAYNRQLILQ